VTEIDTLWDFNDPVNSEVRFREAMVTARGDAQAELGTQVARALGLQGRFDEGHRLLDNLFPRSGSPAEVRVLLERGRLFNSAGEAERSVPHFLAARDCARSIGKFGLEIDALHMLAISDAANAEAWTEEGFRRVGQSDDQAAKRWLGPLLNNLGWCRFDAGRLESALEAFRASRAAYESANKRDEVAIARWSEARCLREMGDVQWALEIQLDLASTNPKPDPYVFEELVALYTASGDQVEAQRWESELERVRPPGNEA
jgi:tetratricopeptide (TPR) repeat protein